MKRSAMIWGLAVLALVGAACSEPEPEATSTTKATGSSASCDGARLLACARSSTLGDLVPAKATKATGTPITLGMINQENTPAGSFPELSQAAQAAIAFVNDQLGGIDGHPIALKVCNTKFSAEGSTNCGQELVDAEVPAVLGGIDVFGNGIDTLEKNDIPFVGGIPVSDQSVTASNSFQWSGGSWGAIVAMANYAATKLEAKNVAIVYSDFGPITQSAEYGEKVLKDAGVEVELVPFPILSTDMNTPMHAAASNNPDAILVMGADTSCKSGFDSLSELEIEAQAFFTGACASPTIINPLDTAKTDGAIFNIEGPVVAESNDKDGALYAATIEKYGKGLDPVGAGTVTYRSFMNLYVVLRELGADNLTPKSITDALRAKKDAPSFNGHDYTCDGKQFEGLPAICSPQQILAQMDNKKLEQISDWIDVGSIYGS